VTLFNRTSISPSSLTAVESTFDTPRLPACRSRLTLVTDPPLDPHWFPGPALRGLIGRGLQRLGAPAATAFLHQRFLSAAPDSPVPWRMAFVSPPDPARAAFNLEITTFGTAAAADLAAICATLDLPGLRLDLPGRSFNIRLLEQFPLEASVITLDAPSRRSAPISQLLPTALYLLTPLVINTRGRRLPAADLAVDTRPLLDSLRLRFADLAGIRRKHPLLPLFPESLPASRATLHDVQLHLPLQGSAQTLTGITGTLHWHRLPPAAISLLHQAPWIGCGRNTTYGAGSIILQHQLQPEHGDLGL
jgi:hypothetical protein